MKLGVFVAVAGLLFAATPEALASQAYGSINNFDVVNDTGEECHGFEIEIEDAHSTDVSYTYDYNHYGTPTIREDNSDPLHPRVYVRYESKKNPDGTWASYTAIPAAPLNPTNGHEFVNPNVNIGGEHFGVGFYGNRGVVRYFWLVDDGFGSLARGPQVNIATPAFTFQGGAVAAVIEAPQEEAPLREFSDAQWVKVTRT